MPDWRVLRDICVWGSVCVGGWGEWKSDSVCSCMWVLCTCVCECVCARVCLRNKPGVNFTNILWAAFSNESVLKLFYFLHFGFVIFCQKKMGAKAAHKLLVKLISSWDTKEVPICGEIKVQLAKSVTSSQNIYAEVEILVASNLRLILWLAMSTCLFYTCSK